MLGKRNAIRYNSVGLFVTEDLENGKVLKFFNRVQSVNLSVDIQRENVQHIGSENFLVRKIVSAPQVSIQMEYLMTDGYEEDVLGLNIQRPGFPYANGTIHKNLKDNKTLFLAIGEEQFDLIRYTEKENKFKGIDIIGIGNCFITNFSINAGIGGLATASVTMVASDLTYQCEGSHSWSEIIEELSALLRQASPNAAEVEGESDFSDREEDFITFQDETKIFLQHIYQIGERQGVGNPSLDLPNRGAIKDIEGVAFDPKMYNSVVSAIPPGGITLKVKNINVGGPIIGGKDEGNCMKGDANIQSFDISVPFEREDLYGFQSMHVYGRKMKYPQIGTLSMSLLSSAFKSGRLSEIFCKDNFYEIEINFDNQCNFTCNGAPKKSHMKLIISNAKLDSYSISQGIGSVGTVDCNFSFGISTSRGIHIFGSKPETRMGSFFLNSEGKYVQNTYGFHTCSLTDSDQPTNLNIESRLGQREAPTELGIHKVLESSDSPSEIKINKYLESSDSPQHLSVIKELQLKDSPSNLEISE